MDSKLVRGGIKYLVKWKGYPNQVDLTWEPENKILQDNKDEFHENHPNAPQQVDTCQINFRERVIEEESVEQGWLNGKLNLT
jgi:hypothetical protein